MFDGAASPPLYSSRSGPGEASGGELPAKGLQEVVMAEQAEPSPPPDRSVTYTDQGPDLPGHAERLRELREEFLRMGGPDRVERQHAQGKLTVRERLDILFDAGTFQEFALLAHHQAGSPQMQGKHTPADGGVTGVGGIAGRRGA